MSVIRIKQASNDLIEAKNNNKKKLDLQKKKKKKKNTYICGLNVYQRTKFLAFLWSNQHLWGLIPALSAHLVLHFFQTDLISSQSQTSGTVKPNLLPSFFFDLRIKVDWVPMQIFQVDSWMVQSDQPCCVPCWSSSEFWFFKQDDLFVALEIEVDILMHHDLEVVVFISIWLCLVWAITYCSCRNTLGAKKCVFVDNNTENM